LRFASLSISKIACKSCTDSQKSARCTLSFPINAEEK